MSRSPAMQPCSSSSWPSWLRLGTVHLQQSGSTGEVVAVRRSGWTWVLALWACCRSASLPQQLPADDPSTQLDLLVQLGGDACPPHPAGRMHAGRSRAVCTWPCSSTAGGPECCLHPSSALGRPLPPPMPLPLPPLEGRLATARPPSRFCMVCCRCWQVLQQSWMPCSELCWTVNVAVRCTSGAGWGGAGWHPPS